MKPPPKPLLIFDGDCGFCRQWIERWRRITGDRVDYAPFQEVAERFPEIPRERFAEAVHFLGPDGRVSRGAEAVFRSIATAPGRGWLLGLYRRLPGFAPLSEWCYRRVARHRPLFTRLTRWIWGKHVVPPGERRTVWIFLRLLGIVYTIAFVSYWVQFAGLVGSEGVLPARDLMAAVRVQYGPLGPWVAPTLCWLSAGDLFLHTLCAVGTLLSLLLIVGVAPAACLGGLWATYLSLVVVGQEFFLFQWDSLLLETGFLAIFLAPWRRWSSPTIDPAPPGPVVWLFRWLLFRLMVSSAAVKLLSGDPTWQDLTALRFHFETQPLPPWTAWYVHHLPAWTLRISTLGTLAIEGIVPVFLFAPRRIRFTAAATLGALQGLIILTGNYAFFNLLTLALCVLALDDAVWPRWLRFPRVVGADGPRAGLCPRGILQPATLVILILTLAPFARALGVPPNWMRPLSEVEGLVAPLRIANHYGLFAVMTTRRPEIVVEGSDDGKAWRAYECRYKPGDVKRRPRFVAPYQPRLDWQLWFAALSDYRTQPWFLLYCQQLLRGSRPILAMLDGNPFPGHAPRYIRATVYDYHFTDPAARRATGAWWRREELGLYCPVLTLIQGRLAKAPDPAPTAAHADSLAR